MSGPRITRARLMDVLDYDPETGVFRWKAKSHRCSWVKIGDVAGSISPTPGTGGYRLIVIDGKILRAHSLAWLYVYGEWPPGIDHENGVRDDNKIKNLRIASAAENAKNQALRKDNKTGRVGVRIHRGKYLARIRVSGKLIHIGVYTDFELACAARTDAEKKYGFHPNHGSVRQ